jgi:hypothetical protein
LSGSLGEIQLHGELQERSKIALAASRPQLKLTAKLNDSGDRFVGRIDGAFSSEFTAARLSAVESVEGASPVAVVLREAAQFDLVVIGVSEEWGLESRLFGWRPERIARDCPTSMLIVRRDAPAGDPRKHSRRCPGGSRPGGGIGQSSGRARRAVANTLADGTRSVAAT